MPPYKQYVSDKQRRWAHTANGLEALGAEDVAGKDRASKGLALPERVRHDKGPGHHLRRAGGNRGTSK